MRGFVITVLSVTLIMVLILLAISLRNSQLGTERALLEPLPLIYGAALLDDTAYEFNSIVGPEIYINESNESVRVTVRDTLQSRNFSSEITTYGTFLSGEVATRTASNISTNFTNLTNGVIRLFINEEYNYTNDHNNNESLFTRNGGTDATSYEIAFTVTAVRTEVTHIEFNESGTMNVTIVYTDLNGTEVEQGSVFPDHDNTFRVGYAGGGSMTITAGRYNENSGSLLMKTDGIRAITEWTVVLPAINATKKHGYEYDAVIDYTQGPVRIVKRIGK